MRIGQVIRGLVGATAIYVVMAACAASGDGAGADSNGARPPGSSGGSSGSGIGPGITNPVPTASAAPVPAVAYTENCDKTYDFGPTRYRYAQHDFPGATKADLASVMVLIMFSDSTNHPPGFNTLPTLPFIKDGAVAYVCGTDSAPTTTSVTFVKP